MLQRLGQLGLGKLGPTGMALAGRRAAGTADTVTVECSHFHGHKVRPKDILVCWRALLPPETRREGAFQASQHAVCSPRNIVLYMQLLANM